MSRRNTPYLKLDWGQAFCGIQFEFQFLYEQILNNVEGFIQKNKVIPIDKVGFMIPIGSLTDRKFPYLNKLTLLLKDLMNEEYLRILYTDPAQFDPDTPSKKLDTYYPHIDKLSNEEIPVGAVIVPIQNCNRRTLTGWHTISKNHTSIVNFDWVDVIYQLSLDTMYCSTSISQDSAYLLRTDIFHSVHNKSGKRRVIGAWHVKSSLTWEQAVRRLREKFQDESDYFLLR